MGENLFFYPDNRTNLKMFLSMNLLVFFGVFKYNVLQHTHTHIYIYIYIYIYCYDFREFSWHRENKHPSRTRTSEPQKISSISPRDPAAHTLKTKERKQISIRLSPVFQERRRRT